MFTCALASGDDKSLNIWGNECEKPVITLRKNLMGFIYQLFRNGVTDFYVNAEYGIPLWSGEIIAGMKMYNDVRLHIVIPYENQSRDWPEEWRDKYYKVQERADSVKLADRQYSDASYHKAYEIMVDASDCIFLFGEKMENSYVAEYAKRSGIKVSHISADSLL